MFKFLAIFLLTLAACQKNQKMAMSSQQNTETKSQQSFWGSSIPSWYINQENNTNEALFGYGDSPDKQTAIENALANLKERIHSSLSSSTFMQDSTIGNVAQNEYSKTIKIKTPNIDLRGYKIEKSEFIKNTHYIWISIEKSTIADSLYQSLNEKMNVISPQFEKYQLTQNVLSRTQLINELYQKCAKYMEIEKFYQSIGYSFPNKTCNQVLENFNNFSINHSVEITKVNPIIYDILSIAFAKKFAVSLKAPNVITYTTEVQTSQFENNYIAGIQITIIQQNSPIKFQKNCLGSSINSKEQAINAAFEGCLNQAKNQSFEEFIGI